MLKIRSLSPILLAVGLFALGCGDSHSDDEVTKEEPMTARLAAFQVELAEMDELIEGHETAIMGAADLAAATAEHDSYATEAEEIHEHIHHALEEMGTCAHEGHGPHTDGIETSLTSVDSELAAHGSAVSAAADLAAVQAEVGDHHAAMAKLLADIRTEHDELAAEAADFMCPIEETHGH